MQVEAKLHELTRSSISSNVFTAVLASYDTAPNKIITTEFKHHQGPYYTYVIFRRQLLLAVKLKIQHVHHVATVKSFSPRQNERSS